MTFNHYSKIKCILDAQPAGWYIRQINKPTKAQNFKGEVKLFDHYYRIYDAHDTPIKYCKFQQPQLLASILKIPVEALPIINE